MLTLISSKCYKLMMLNIDLKAFANSVLNTIYDLDEIHLRSDDGSDDALSGMLEEIKEFTELNDRNIQQNRYKHFKIPDTAPEDYQERFLEIKPGCFALAGIRLLAASLFATFTRT